MARGAAASSHRDDPDAGESKASKRRCVQSACVPCRKRKSKCDGGTPVCATCTAVYKTGCYYDPESESRRSKAAPSNATTRSKRDASLVPAAAGLDTASSAEYVINLLRALPEEHVIDFISHLRKDPDTDVASLTEFLRKSVTLPQTSPLDDQSLETDLSVLLGKPAVTLTGQSRHFGHSASLGLVPEEENFAGSHGQDHGINIERQGTTWTSVTSDLAFVEKLFSLYFTWCHPFYVIFSRECFYRDFRSGRNKYCSALLVNAICAYACHLTDDPAGRTDPSNFRTAGDHFFAEARKLLFENETPSLTKVQALGVMSMREPSTGRDSSGFGYIGRCMRMCVELGLHLNNSASPELGLTPSEIEVRKVTFWGCFTLDSVWSVCVGRIAQLPRAAITLDKPILDEAPGLPEANMVPPQLQFATVTTGLFLQHFTTLSELVNDNNYMFFAPKERLTSSRLLDCYNKYQTWHQKLPPPLKLEGREQPEPHTLVLHMLYHTVIVHLFRPMLKVDLIHSDILPRNICIEAANKVSDIVRIYRRFYDFRVAHLVIPHILLTICVVHLLYSKDNKTSYRNLVEGLHGLEDINECHYFGTRSFHIIYSLSKKWDLPWPEELRQSKLMPKSVSMKSEGTISPVHDPLMFPPNTMNGAANHIGPNTAYSSMSQAHRRESLSMFRGPGSVQIPPHSNNISQPASVPVAQHIQSPNVTQTPTPFNSGIPLSSYQYPQSMSTVSSNLPATTTSPRIATAESLFWNPIPGIPGPILPRGNYQVSPMGLDSVLQSSEMGDRLGRDGFKISEDWQSSQMNGFPHGTSNHFAHQNNQSSGSYMHRGSTSYAPPNNVVAYQQSPLHAQHGHHRQAGQQEYDGGWYSNQMN